MQSEIRSSVPMICNDVHELERALSFVTDECKLVTPLMVTYKIIDGEGFIEIECCKEGSLKNG